MLRCTNEDCEHVWFESSALAEGADCLECGETAVVVNADEELLDAPPEPERVKPRLVFARQLARQMLGKHDVAEPFVDVFAIAAAEGFEVVVKRLPKDLSGQLVGTMIEVSADEVEVRQRFTVAHELGHHALGSTHGFAGGVAQKAFEREANAFAGELLVPGRMLRDQGTTDAADLRRLFRVSRKTLEIAAQHNQYALTGDV
jgi:hypothetical protein